MKKHLLEGVKKGAFDEVEATRRFDEWIRQNEAKIEAKKSNLEKTQDDQLSIMLKEEKRINEARAAKLAKRNADLAAKVAAGDKALVAEVLGEEAPVQDQAPDSVAEEAAPEVAEESAPDVVAEDKPQE
jgi:small subunit ribosomal protein S16